MKKRNPNILSYLLDKLSFFVFPFIFTAPVNQRSQVKQESKTEKIKEKESMLKRVEIILFYNTQPEKKHPLLVISVLYYFSLFIFSLGLYFLYYEGFDQKLNIPICENEQKYQVLDRDRDIFFSITALSCFFIFFFIKNRLIKHLNETSFFFSFFHILTFFILNKIENEKFDVFFSKHFKKKEKGLNSTGIAFFFILFFFFLYETFSIKSFFSNYKTCELINLISNFFFLIIVGWNILKDVEWNIFKRNQKKGLPLVNQNTDKKQEKANILNLFQKGQTVSDESPITSTQNTGTKIKQNKQEKNYIPENGSRKNNPKKLAKEKSINH